jgi:hypothetical protein
MRVRNSSLWAALVLTFAAPSLAEAEPPAVWYRASEACPSGAQFLEKLAENSRNVRLAQAGDHLDFVVTLVATGKETVGRLERQTNGGIVAIRELRDATCGQVADALALSLGLALTPGQSTAAPVAEKSAGAPADLVEVPPNAQTETQSSIATPAPSEETATVPHSPSPTAARGDLSSSTHRWSAGLAFGPMIGISTRPLPRAELFIDLRPAWIQILPKFSLRAGLAAAWGSSETAVGSVRRWIVTSRAEACPTAFGAGRLELRPCLAFELGATGASAAGQASVDDRSLWAAPGGELRFALALQPEWLWLEASGGALLPLTRNEIFSGSRSLYRDALAVFHANLGISLRLP